MSCFNSNCEHTSSLCWDTSEGERENIPLTFPVSSITHLAEDRTCLEISLRYSFFFTFYQFLVMLYCVVLRSYSRLYTENQTINIKIVVSNRVFGFKGSWGRLHCFRSVTTIIAKLIPSTWFPQLRILTMIENVNGDRELFTVYVNSKCGMFNISMYGHCYTISYNTFP